MTPLRPCRVTFAGTWTALDLHFSCGHSQLQWPCTFGMGERKVRLLQRERCRGHTKPGPALPSLVGLCHHTSKGREASWWGGHMRARCLQSNTHTLLPLHVPAARSHRWPQATSTQHGHDSAVSLHHPVLQWWDSLCAKNPSALLRFFIIWTISLRVKPESGIIIWNIKELETQWGKTSPVLRLIFTCVGDLGGERTSVITWKWAAGSDTVVRRTLSCQEQRAGDGRCGSKVPLSTLCGCFCPSITTGLSGSQFYT